MTESESNNENLIDSESDYINIFPFLNNTTYIFNENIINIIQNEIILELYQYEESLPIENFYKYMILKLIIRNFTYEEIYNGVGFYLEYILGVDEMHIVREQFINIYNNRHTSNLANRLLNIFTLFNNFINYNNPNNESNENNENLEDVKLIIPKEDLNNIKSLKFKDLSENIKKDNNICSICQYTFKKYNKVRLLNCNHIYHQRCIDKWLSEMSYKCPICREACGNYKPNINNII